ncbi:MAG: hypothetical protein IJ638_03700 [Alphaproteobacteria bacterium]|nr:hypothetical protein [Alphaproteobacteria bacterium]
MVETKNNYKKRYNRGPVRKRYSNNNGKRHGLLNFLFSFEGRISKNLFIGFGLFLTVISFAFDMLSVAVPAEGHKIFDIVFNVINLILLWILVALGYKRAHSLGISGFYSIIGTILFKPFFCFLRTERDFANDGAYKHHFDRFKKVGYFFDRNMFTRIIYILLIGVLAAIPYVVLKKSTLSPKDFTDIMLFILGIVVFNIFQLFVINARWFRRYYSNIVKVLSFIGYNIFVVAVSVFFYSAYILMMMMQSLQVAPK